MPRTPKPISARTANPLVLVAAAALLPLLPAAPLAARASGPTPAGAAIFQDHCAACHDTGLRGAPPRAHLASLSPAEITRVLRVGAMRAEAASLRPGEIAAVAAYLHSAAFSAGATANDPIARDRCAAEDSHPAGAAAGAAARAGENWNGWSNTLANDRQSRGPITAANLGRLRVRWAFAVPQATTMAAPPAVVNRVLYLGSASGRVYALRAGSGCVLWEFQAKTGVRTSVVLGGKGARRLAFFGDGAARVYAVSAADGRLVWSAQVDATPGATLTGSPQYWRGRLYVPVSSAEEVLGANPSYACCRFRGSLAAFNAADGRLLWRAFTIRRPATARPAAKGRVAWGPSGAAIWSPPTLDPAHGRIYVATGDNYSDPPTPSSDAILALSLADGHRLWTRQLYAGDVYSIACALPGNPNQPGKCGPDYDFGAPPMLVTSGGRQLLIAGQKSGVVTALDPSDGAVVWQTRVARGSSLGGVEWGMAADGEHAYAAISDIAFLPPPAGRAFHLIPNPRAGGGLAALDLATGRLAWSAAPVLGTCGSRGDCGPAQMAAVTAIPGAALSGSMDGHLRAYAAGTGRVLWDFDAARSFAAVDAEKAAGDAGGKAAGRAGGEARGGSFGAAGPVVADGMLFLVAGYPTWGGMPGNLLLALAPARSSPAAAGPTSGTGK